MKEMTLREFASMGGKARAAKLSKRERREIARRAGSAPKRPRSPSIKRCAWCGDTFTGQTSRKWCSSECKANAKKTP